MTMDPTQVLTIVISIGGFIVVLVGGVIARDRYMSRQIREGDEKLHERINRVRDDMVHKADQDKHLERIDSGLRELRDEQRAHRSEIITLLGKLLGQNSGK